MLLTVVTDDVPVYLVIPKANHPNKLKALIIRSYQSNCHFSEIILLVEGE